LRLHQARRQDVAAGGVKNQKEGPKTRRGATFLKYSIGCMQQPVGQTWNGWGTDFKWGGPDTTALHWRRPCLTRFPDDGSANFCPLVTFQRKAHFTFHRRNVHRRNGCAELSNSFASLYTIWWIISYFCTFFQTTSANAIWRQPWLIQSQMQ